MWQRPRVAGLVDGKTDYIFVDDEKKIPRYITVQMTPEISRKPSAALLKIDSPKHKGNDLTVEAVDAGMQSGG